MRNSTLSLVVAVVISSAVKAQCISAGTRNGSSFSTDNAVGNISFLNPANAEFSDNVRATANALILGDITNYEKVEDFGFAIPVGSTICGIEVQVEKSAVGLLENVTDHSVRLLKNGAIAGTNHASSAVWPTSENVVSYGGSGDLWGTTWTPAEINASNFGFVISANLNALAVLPQARIDHIQITVYYSNIILPLIFEDFNLHSSGDKKVELDWKVAPINDGSYYVLERSEDGINFVSRSSIEENNLQIYHVNDDVEKDGTYYFRIGQVTQNGQRNYSEMKSITFCSETFITYPNPASEYLTVSLTKEELIKEINVYSCQGQCISSIKENESLNGKYQLRVNELPPGIYQIRILTSTGKYFLSSFNKSE